MSADAPTSFSSKPAPHRMKSGGSLATCRNGFAARSAVRAKALRWFGYLEAKTCQSPILTGLLSLQDRGPW